MKPWYSVKTGNKLGASEAQMLADMPEGRQTMIAQNNFRPRLQELVGQRKEIVMTRPASMPLHIMDGSGFFVRTHHIQRVAPKAPVAEASIVFTATTAMRRSVPARLEPGLKPNQPNARMNVPSIANGRLCGTIG